MLSTTISISFLSCAIFIALYFLSEGKQINKKLISPLLILSLIVFISANFLQAASIQFKFLQAFKGFLALGFISTIFNMLKHNKIMQIALFIALLAGLKYLNQFANTFHYTISENGIDNDWELLIQLDKDNDTKDIENLVQKYNLSLEPAFEMENTDSPLSFYYAINVPDSRASQMDMIQAELNNDSDVIWTEFNEVIQISPFETEVETQRTTKGLKSLFSDPKVNEQWSLNISDVDQYYELFKSGLQPVRKARIAILDTGVDENHEDLKGNFKSTKSKYNKDVQGHGTHCAGIAAAVTNNGIGIASMVPDNSFVEITSIKVLSDNGRGTQRKIIQGMIEAADISADVVSMSLGGFSNQSRQKAYSDAVAYGNAKGAIFVVAAGNSNRNAKNYSPANAKGVIAVSALDENLKRAEFSNRVDDLEMAVAAPGVNILSTFPNNQYKALSGTSMATPFVAGLVGVFKSINPDLKTDEVFDLLDSSGQYGSDTGRRVRPSEALKKLISD